MRKRTAWVRFVVGVVAAFGLLGGCTATTLRDTHTIHNREATRIWVIQNRQGGGPTTERVIFCDTGMAQAGRELCISWDG